MNRHVEILQRKTVFHRFIFKIDEIALRHPKFDGSMSDPIKRLSFERGMSAAVLLHDPDADRLLFCEQFRAPTITHGDGWVIELPAGVVDAGEDPEATARRETVEETGQQAAQLTKIASVYPSPGGSSELIHIFYGEVSLRLDLPETAGLASEGEDIRILHIPTGEAFSKLSEGGIEDAKTMIAVQWLQQKMNLEDLR